MLAHGPIRKVYLCRARITRLRSGDLILFYMSKDQAYAANQSARTEPDHGTAHENRKQGQGELVHDTADHQRRVAAQQHQ